jgi:ketosteroid isomerase-like protein
MGHARSRELVVLLAFLCACRPDTASDRAAILRLYQATGRAHLAHDSAGFVAADADTVLNISNGSLHPRTRAEALAGVGAYLHGRVITEVTDLDPPRIDVARDGRTATLIGHVRVSGTLNGAPFTFTAAWLDLLRKDDDGWHIVVHANTEGP